MVKGKEPYEKLIEALTQKLANYFSILEGSIVGKEDNTLLIEMEQKKSIKPGMKLIIYRESKEIRYPATEKVLGKRSVDIRRGKGRKGYKGLN